MIYKHIRSKNIINLLSDMNCNINYEKILKIETNIAEAIVKKMEDSDDVNVPPSIQKECSIYFVIDNCDFQNDTPDGKHEFHSTVSQNSTNPLESKSLKIERNQNKTVDLNPFPAKEIIPKLIPPPKHNYQEIENTSPSIEYCSHIDILSFTMKLMDNTFIDNHQTWTGFKSMVTKARSITNINALPLYLAPPPDFSNLYQALKSCQNISAAVAPSRKTIITLDLQLYAKALQLQGRNEITNNFVFRPGELHIVFSFQHAIGKYIENSGLDQSFIDCNIYGPATVSQYLMETT